MNEPLIILVLTGQMGAGKSTVAEHFKKQGFEHIRVGQFFKSQAIKRGITFVEYMAELNSNLGEEKKAKLIMKYVKKRTQKAKGIVIESAYSTPLIKDLKSTYSRANIYIITICSNKKLRVRRIARRNNLSKSKSHELVNFWDSERKKIGINEVIKISDLIIDNSKNNELHPGQNVEKFIRFKQYSKLIPLLKRFHLRDQHRK